MQQNYSIRDAAEYLGVNEAHVERLIRDRAIAAFDVGKVGAKRPTWRIAAEELERFKLSRSNQVPVAPAQRRRVPDQGSNFIK
jgi:excisionase family DNA binding protein